MKIDGHFTAKNDRGDTTEGNCLKSEFIETINDSKKYYSSHTIIYYLDGSIEARFSNGILMQNIITIYKPFKK